MNRRVDECQTHNDERNNSYYLSLKISFLNDNGNNFNKLFYDVKYLSQKSFFETFEKSVLLLFSEIWVLKVFTADVILLCFNILLSPSDVICFGL